MSNKLSFFMGFVFSIIGGFFTYLSYQEMRSDSNAVIGVLLGLVFLIVGLGFIFNALYNSHKRKKLKLNGTLINAQITGIAKDYSTIINDENPYIFTCGYLAPNGSYFEFKSKGILLHDINPNQFMGRVIPVYLDPKKPSYYYVDCEWMTK